MRAAPVRTIGCRGDASEAVAVLCSGGLDSVVLVAHEARTGDVQPIYVAVGLAWEPGYLG